MRQLHCLFCFQNIQKELSFFDWICQDTLLCGECKKKLHRINTYKKIGECSVYILYLYNDMFESMIYQWKENRDIALKNVFLYDVRKELFDKFRHYTIVVMPSSQEKIKERGFHHLMEMFQIVGLPMIDPFEKLYNWKQSLQSLEDRHFINKVIRLKKGFVLPATPLLLVDDVCTSGSTLKWAYHLLQKHIYTIEALAVSAHPLFVEFCDKR
ncbi:MAG: ComF family protein [Erysipelotrichaceae bacterium]|nr:ComF family protein [Erysipelotrichaceae bacterium]